MTRSDSSPERRGRLTAGRLVGAIVGQAAIFGVLLFGPAGTLNWPRGWLFMGGAFVGTVASLMSLAPTDVLDERYRPPMQQGQPLADKIVLALFLLAYVAMNLLIPLDVFRLHLLAKPPLVVSAMGLVVAAAGWWIITLAMRTNAFAAPVVKLQEERGQRVVDTGPYAMVRHPMYAGGLLFFVGTGLWLESYASALFAVVPMIFVAARVLIEERFLASELPGYAAYRGRVRWRIIPFVW